MAERMLCAVEGCGNPVLNKKNGLCNKHYLRMRRYGDTGFSKINRGQTGQPCKVPGCSKPSGYRGMCRAHYKRQLANGDPEVHSEKFKKRIKWLNDHAGHQSDDCLIWPFSVNDHGRGTVQIGGRAMSAARYICGIANGPPPTERHHSAHSCGNGHIGCVNPRHLRWATPSENELDKIAHGTIRRGTKVNTNKLSEADVMEIRSLEGAESAYRIAKMYGVTLQNVRRIQLRLTWAWLD